MANIDKEKRRLRQEEGITTFWVVILGSFIAAQLFFVYKSVEGGTYTWNQYFIEYGDSLGALLAAISLTFYLTQLQYSRQERITALLEAEKDRKILLKENSLNRNIMLVKEQLDFYSELYDDFAEIYDYRDPNIDIHMIKRRNNINAAFQNHKVKEKYPRYVKNDELNVFTEYYAKIYKQLDLKNMNNIQRDEALQNMDDVIDHILKRYRELSKEYRKLINQ
jgi:hypothetical protein